jgi:hypothetical protein
VAVLGGIVAVGGRMVGMVVGGAVAVSVPWQAERNKLNKTTMQSDERNSLFVFIVVTPIRSINFVYVLVRQINICTNC